MLQLSLGRCLFGESPRHGFYFNLKSLVLAATSSMVLSLSKPNLPEVTTINWSQPRVKYLVSSSDHCTPRHSPSMGVHILSHLSRLEKSGTGKGDPPPIITAVRDYFHAITMLLGKISRHLFLLCWQLNFWISQMQLGAPLTSKMLL